MAKEISTLSLLRLPTDYRPHVWPIKIKLYEVKRFFASLAALLGISACH